MHQGIRMSFPWNVLQHFGGPSAKHAAGDVTIRFCEETSATRRLCRLWNLNVWFASSRRLILNLFSRCHSWKPSYCVSDCLRKKEARRKEHPRHLLCTNKTFKWERVCKFYHNDTFYLVIRAGPPSRSCLSHMADCFTRVSDFTSSATLPTNPAREFSSLQFSSETLQK